jgi:hypothetical protein
MLVAPVLWFREVDAVERVARCVDELAAGADSICDDVAIDIVLSGQGGAGEDRRRAQKLPALSFDLAADGCPRRSRAAMILSGHDCTSLCIVVKGRLARSRVPSARFASGRRDESFAKLLHQAKRDAAVLITDASLQLEKCSLKVDLDLAGRAGGDGRDRLPR